MENRIVRSGFFFRPVHESKSNWITTRTTTKKNPEIRTIFLCLEHLIWMSHWWWWWWWWCSEVQNKNWRKEKFPRYKKQKWMVTKNVMVSIFSISFHLSFTHGKKVSIDSKFQKHLKKSAEKNTHILINNEHEERIKMCLGKPFFLGFCLPLSLLLLQPILSHIILLVCCSKE